MNMDRPDHPIHDPVMGSFSLSSSEPEITRSIGENCVRVERQGRCISDGVGTSIGGGGGGCCRPLLAELKGVFGPFFKTLVLAWGRAPRIAGEALAVTGTAALVPQPKLKSLGRRWPPINPSRNPCVPLIDGADVTQDASLLWKVQGWATCYWLEHRRSALAAAGLEAPWGARRLATGVC
ncbi:hypothetical protein AAWM_01382 [Aspergillus awamori]|uniref:Uncharacterized protein n=1 Tax=Aspergillus awamori TaxID=105351 RepID=A0A401KGU8_ASPAW|nr:hypothetical protein AAWM_01382 [Aspergillus awamori]